MATILETLEAAVSHHQAGRLDLAEQLYRQILAADPNHADALHLLGLIASQVGRHGTAVELINRAVELNGSVAAYHSNLAAAYKAQDRLDEAIACCRRALELDPTSVEAHGNLANALKEQGKLDEAVDVYRRALELKPHHPETHYNLGNVFTEQGALEEAAAAYRRALELKPDYAEANNNLGSVLQVQGKFDQAIALYQRAIQLKPNYAEAFNNLGTVSQVQGKLDAAIAWFERALAAKPGYAEAQINLGTALQGQGRLDEAVSCYQRVLDYDPANPDAYSNLGNAIQEQGKFDEAVNCFRRAVELKRNYADAYNNLGTAYQIQGQLDAAVVAFRMALDLKPAFAEAHSNLLLTLHYRPESGLAELREAHEEFDRKYAAALRQSWVRPENDRDPNRRLRLGFVSPDFGQHPVGFFLIRALENLDRSEFEIACYCDRVLKDDLTARFQAAAAIWCDVSALRDADLAEQIRADRIDILFDLAGHTAKNRLLAFARKPAPIQIAWAGYPGTTGLAAMDYILADRLEIPTESEKYYTERVLRMPHGYVCYDPPPYAPEVSPLPALQRGFITFGSFNNSSKINPRVVELWSKILHRVPQSRLVLKNRGMDNASIAGALTQGFARHGIDADRLEFLGWSQHPELLAEYGRIDMALDPFPYGGGLTTCEALWMGVPVITCPAETFASRHSLSHVSNVGITETIARDSDDYVELAVTLTSDLRRLSSLRRKLRQQMAASPLCDGQQFAGSLTPLLRKVWRDWCQSEVRP